MRCSSISAVDTDFFGFLQAALDALAAEVPQAYATLAGALGVCVVRIVADGHPMDLLMAGDTHVLRGRGPHATVELHLDRDAVVDLIEAKRSLLDALLEGQIVLKGASDDLGVFHDALTAFVRGLARSMSSRELLGSYLRGQPPRCSLRAAPVDADRSGERHV